MYIDWGSVPDWFAGLGATLALVFAAFAVVAANRTNRLQKAQLDGLEKESKDRRKAERRRMASNVALYISTEWSQSERLPVVWYINANPGPIYGLHIFCFSPEELVNRKYHVNGPHQSRVRMGTLTRHLREWLTSEQANELLDSGSLAVSCSFRDPAGVWWYRTAAGELNEAPNEEAAATAARSSGPRSAGKDGE